MASIQDLTVKIKVDDTELVEALARFSGSSEMVLLKTLIAEEVRKQIDVLFPTRHMQEGHRASEWHTTIVPLKEEQK